MSGTLPRGGPPPPPVAPQYNPVGIEVPFLVNNKEKWISGIVEETTCGDVVKALLASEGRLKGIDDEQLDKFVMVERWRKVERPLKRDSCLLKIWQAWAGEAQDVQFILKRVSTKRSSKRSGVKLKRTNSKLIKQLADFEKTKLRAGCENEDESCVTHMQGNIQALLKIIISQRETIQNQLGTLKAKDMYLKTLDKSLSCSDGREYVLRNYLEQIPEHAEETLEESQDSGCGSGNDTQDSCTEANTPDHTAEASTPLVGAGEAADMGGGGGGVGVPTVGGGRPVGGMGSPDTVLSNLFEKLFHLNQKLEVQEDDIFRLTLQMEAMLQARHSGEPCLTEEQESILHTELQVAQEELDTMAKLNSRLGYEIKRNELALTNMMKNYDGRQQFARRLEQDVTRAEVGTCTTQQQPSITPLSSPSTSSSSPHQGLNRIEEETDWEEGCESEEDEESDDEELRVHGHCVSGGDLPFPVLAPPEQFQNCLSPSATYESGCMRVAVASPAYSNSNDSVSSALSSSTATEKSVRFSDRDQILSTPEPRQSGSAWLPQVYRAESHRSLEAGHGVRVKSILKPEHQTCTKNFVGGVGGRGVGGHQHEVTSFLLDTEDGTLV